MTKVTLLLLLLLGMWTDSTSTTARRRIAPGSEPGVRTMDGGSSYPPCPCN